MRGFGSTVCCRSAALGASLSLVVAPARAAEVGSEDSPLSVDVHGFASQGFIVTTSNDYIDPDTRHGSFKFSEVGINFTKSFFRNQLRIGMQLFAQDVGPTGNFNAKMDWFYVDYRWQDWLGFRAGRVKIPFGFYNEVNDIDSARVPVLLPQSVYPLQARNFLFAQSGGELYGFVRSRDLGALDYRLFGGTIFIDAASLVSPGSSVQVQINVPYVVGGRLIWETPLDGLRLGGTVEALHLDATAFLGPSTSVALPDDQVVWLASAEYARQDVTLTAEYGRAHASQGTSNPMIQPPLSQTSEGGYAMATYRATPWFDPGVYYSLFFPDVQKREGRADRQHDVALTLRFDLNAHWLVKLEGHYMAGTAGLAASASPSTADRYWGAFFVKTTGYF
jgi:hypothetical protein